jgi:zinc transport system substrate-binding protein
MKSSINNAALMLCIFLAVALVTCKKIDNNSVTNKSDRIKIVVSLFPIYDFSKNIGKEKVEVFLLLPPGVESHSFEPKPSDIVQLNNSDIFIYTNKYMEPWAENIVKGIENKNLLVIDSSKNIVFAEESEAYGKARGSKEKHSEIDPHIWLDIDNAKIMVDNILAGVVQKDPANKDFYKKNADEYKSELDLLDKKYKEGLVGCKKNIFINSGHSAFSYIARKYGLKYISVYGLSPDAEPTSKNLIKISKTLKENGLNHIFYEELIMPRMAETIAKETGAKLVFLHGAHNVSKEDFEKGISFLALMEKNLENLKTGLQCR